MRFNQTFRVALLATTLGLAGIANASVIYTIDGTSSAGNTVNATAEFSISGNTLTAVVTNLIVNPNTVGQNVSGLFFDLSGVSSLSLASQIAPTTIDVASDGTYTTAGTNVDPGWGFGGSSSLPYGVNALSGALYTPELTIIGAPDSSTNTYCGSSGCGSIAGNGPHNPFIFGTATYNFDFTALTGQNITLDDLSGVQLAFGTKNGGDVNNLCTAGTTCANVPEPSSLALLGLALLVLGITRRRRFHA